MKALSGLLVLHALSLLLACQPPNSQNTLPTASASPVNSSDSSAKLSIMEAVKSPNRSKIAIWQGIDERVVPFNQYHGIQISIVDAQAKSTVKTLPIPLNVQKDYEILDDQLWWQDDQTLLFTGSDDKGQVIYSLDTQRMTANLFYRFPQSAHKWVPLKDKLYFLSGQSLEVLDLQNKQQSSLMRFSHAPVQLFPTAQPELWLVGIGQSITGFALQRTPPEPVTYYLIDTQKKTKQACQSQPLGTPQTALSLNSENPYQQTVVCPQVGQ
jgi:hypothetical protein